MTSENHATVKVDTSMVMSPTGSATQGSPVSPSTSKPMPELPDELVQAGWSKCWSKRENRPYWFNRFTNQSLWEMPVLGQHDVISDPLGLNAAPAEGTGDAGVGNGQRKRRLSEEAAQGGPNSFKRPKIEVGIPVAPTTPIVPISPITPGAKPWNSTTGTEDKPGQHSMPAPAPYRPSVIYWDLDIQTNAVIRERPPANHLPPHPEMELQRAQLTTKLRQHYHELCYQREGIEPPRESFNRWLLERKVLDKGPDPLLPSECDPIISPSMFREVMNDIPIRLSRIKYKEEARKLLFKYAEAAKKMIDSRNATPDSRKVVKWNAEDTMNWLRRDHSASKEDYMDRLEHLRKQCGPHVAAVAKDSVEGICTKIYHISAEYVRRIHQAHQTLLKDCNVSDPEAADVQDRLVYCYPIRLALPSPAQPRVELHFENDIACLRYKGEMVKVNRSHFTKLELLYRYSSIDDPRFEKFLSRVWCLIKRYLVMFGSGVNEGTGLQGALPVPVFEALNKQFGVTFECFASPLNSYFKQFCSAFPDTDGFFGSRGPFLNFIPASGSFEANPPFSEELMDAMVTHFEKLLEESIEPLSFIIFVPEWRDPLTPALHRMETSAFRRYQMSVPAFEHEYRSGSQHICKQGEMYYKAVHGTVVIFLQNAAGFAKWEPTPERIQELLAAYQVSRRALGSPGPSSAPTTTSPASAGGSGDKDSIAAKTAPERSASLDTSPTRQDNSSSSNPVEKTTPPSETASV
ncbi:mRNA (2'-O-methyladenosine-N(6)-)-methyltransferase [Salmo trutta]|uniref:mRNA (2'-O-methyladenosine-N(6)-)-methyltransferase n=1 Tax=Salmo trutta TaxID=8032 RepID=A0A674B866_SALTR|nr:mRNA (2'-O-methyladenosine-N(6)-)-methyltransferase-like [Salmo trutta]XP_029548872.1 mRNA (2'-O-methyladenosine-N(6)-)-methyltransferase-like [Salmo trutta]XP_029548873.1 mRNA (2'-O-methyladenosine-N(6)-)-methyltransferase-like [Salmo trutta]